MELSSKQNALKKDALPTLKGDVRINNDDILNAIPFGAENGCKW